MTLQFAAGKLAERGIATGGQKIFRQLRKIGMLKGLHPTLHAEHMGWMTEKEGYWERGGMSGQYCRVFLTMSGLDEVECELRNAGKVEPPPVSIRDYDLGVASNVKFGF